MAPLPLPLSRLCSCRQTAVYRLFNLAGELLYVGMTDDLQKRFKAHAHTRAEWAAVARYEVTWYDDRNAAARAEIDLIQTLHPVWNIAQRALPGGSELTYYGRIAQDLRAKIYGGEHPAGSQLPTKRDLSAQYGVSMQTIDSAKILLRAEGLIVQRRRAGTFVVDPLPPD